MKACKLAADGTVIQQPLHHHAHTADQRGIYALGKLAVLAGFAVKPLLEGGTLGIGKRCGARHLGKGNALMWIMGILGFGGSLLAFVLSFIPPAQINTGNSAVWYSVLIGGCVVMVVIPFIIYAMRKPSWRDPNAEFAPFHWDHK